MRPPKRRKPRGDAAFFVNPPAWRRSIGSNARAIKEGSNVAKTRMIIITI